MPLSRTDVLRAAVLALLLLSGCVTSTQIRTVPPGASVFVNDQLVGVSPVNFSTPDSAWRPPYRVRAELPGYQTVDGELTPVTATGRITGAIFTLGIVAAVRPMSTFEDSYTFSLMRDPNARRANVSGLNSTQVLEENLVELKRMYDEGTLSKKEYQDAKDRLLKDY